MEKVFMAEYKWIERKHVGKAGSEQGVIGTHKRKKKKFEMNAENLAKDKGRQWGVLRPIGKCRTGEEDNRLTRFFGTLAKDYDMGQDTGDTSTVNRGVVVWDPERQKMGRTDK